MALPNLLPRTVETPISQQYLVSMIDFADFETFNQFMADMGYSRDKWR